VFTGIHHLAFIAADLEETVRFWRDLLGLPLSITAGDDGFKHYFFAISKTDAVAFFWWPGARAMKKKAPGVPTSEPRGFDHVAIGVAHHDDLTTMRDRLLAAGIAVAGPVDHGLTHSIYFTDPNGLSVELAWQTVEQLQPLHFDASPGAAARAGAKPQPLPAQNDSATGALPDITRVDPQAALLPGAIRAGLVRPLPPSTKDQP
jgi:catechol 2,3-dioxygenase-like lactoylglutathione lyase family enzyme